MKKLTALVLACVVGKKPIFIFKGKMLSEDKISSGIIIRVQEIRLSE